MQHLSWWHLSISAVYQPNFYQTFWTLIFAGQNFLDKIFFYSIIFWTKNFSNPNCFETIIFLDPKNVFAIKRCIILFLLLSTSPKSRLQSWDKELTLFYPCHKNKKKNPHRNLCIKGVLEVSRAYVFRQKLSSVKSCLPSKVVFSQRLSITKCCLQSKVTFEWCLPSIVVFHQIFSSIKGCLPSKFYFNQRLSYIKACLPSSFRTIWSITADILLIFNLLGWKWCVVVLQSHFHVQAK